jgi:hypothetical protein
MSRGFGDFEIDDFRDSDFYSGRDFGGGSSSDWNKRTEIQKIQQRESQADSGDHERRNRAEAQRLVLPSDKRAQSRSERRTRDKFLDRDKEFSLRESEIHTLTEIGKFRVVSVDDLAEFAYAGDRSRLDSDLRNLIRQGLVERHGTSALKKESKQVLTLGKQGQRLIRQHGLVPEDQAIYSGLVKPKEADHDAVLYRLYQRVADEIESRGGQIIRVQLDYELKKKLYRKLAMAQAKGERDTQRLKEAFARQMHLPVVQGKVSLPDLRIEYANQEMEISRADLELATGHYHAGHLAGKARAGFQIYARSADAPGLRRVRDDHEIMTSILSL